MRIPANNKQAVASRRYSYRQRSDEIFVPTGATVVNEIKAVLPDQMDADVVADKQCVMPITDTTMSPLRESGANRSVSSFVVALKKHQQVVADTSSVTDGVNDAINDATDPTDSMSKDHNDNQVENQENQFIHTNLKGGNRPYCTSSGSNPNKLGDASSSQTLAERRLQQRSAIFKKGDLENKPSVVNTVLSKKRLNDGDSANNSVMVLTENHRVEPDKPIAMAGKQTWNTKRNITNGVLAPLSQSVNDQNIEKSINVESEENKDTIPSNNKGGMSGGATDFATKLAWAAKLEKRRETFAKKIPSPAHRRQPTKTQCEANISNPEQSGSKDTIASTTNVDKQDATNVEKQDDNAEKKAVNGCRGVEVAVVEEVYPSPSHLDFSNTKAWAAELAKQKVLSDKKKMIDKKEGSRSTPSNKSSLGANGGDDSATILSTRTTVTERNDEKDEFSARLRAKRRQLSEKKRKTSDIVASSDRAEDSVWCDFEIPMAEKQQPQQSVSLSYSGTMDDQSVPLPVSEEDASEDIDEQEVHPTESNPLTPILLLQEKRILSLEKKRQSYIGNVCGEEENATLKLVDIATPMKTHWMESPAGENEDNFFESKKQNESEDENKASSLLDKTPHLDLFHDRNNTQDLSQVHDVSDKLIQDNQVESTSVVSSASSERNATDMKSYPMPRKIDLQLSLTSTQQIAFTKIIAEYETKLECKSSEIEYLKCEISSQHVQILELLGNANAAEQRTETRGKKTKLGFSLKRWFKPNLSRFH